MSEDRWVLDYVKAYLTAGGKTKYAGYTKAYALAIIKKIRDDYGAWVGSGDLMRVMGYTQAGKPLRLLRTLEDEGYLILDERRCRPVEILRYPYFVERPQFVKEQVNELCGRQGIPPAFEEVQRE